jgi:hypothetical protein
MNLLGVLAWRDIATASPSSSGFHVCFERIPVLTHMRRVTNQLGEQCDRPGSSLMRSVSIQNQAPKVGSVPTQKSKEKASAN